MSLSWVYVGSHRSWHGPGRMKGLVSVLMEGSNKLQLLAMSLPDKAQTLVLEVPFHTSNKSGTGRMINRF